ncbi:AEC family transporter [Candidatus Pseudothioglobus singularis]|uniref:Permease n=1 Tax=Candidatus Pseudothioglobus singularis PS1 TaxID=1125411 RepID=A0A0M4LD47_9GAMM|nr:AEC family transporter [Candidatus Pseudothioglobus singularis]ALE01782.1 permease [Candidatus Pseudothioglobus singularis PS1]
MLSNFFQIFLLVSPVFLLIILGNFLRRIKVPDVSFWEINDKLCYWVLIPALLFHYISQINLSSEMLYSYSIIIYVGFFIAILTVLILGKLLGYPPERWTSILQGAVRQNAFIALAITGSLFGDEGLKIASIFMLIYVPSINIIIVTTMVMNFGQSKKNTSNNEFKTVFVELSKNPFILSMIAGLIFSIIQSEKLKVIIDTSGLLGSAALPIMLLTIGAKIKVRDLALTITPILISNFLKLLALPLIAFCVANYLGLSEIEVVVAVIFAAVPTAVSSHTLARQFGADDQLMTSIITTQVVLSFITIPILLAFI